MNEIKVKSISNHQREWRERFTINHTAIAIIENYTPEQQHEAVSQVSIKAGYHPAGYGLYGPTKIEPTANENEYSVSWKTGHSCD